MTDERCFNRELLKSSSAVASKSDLSCTSTALKGYYGSTIISSRLRIAVSIWLIYSRQPGSLSELIHRLINILYCLSNQKRNRNKAVVLQRSRVPDLIR